MKDSKLEIKAGKPPFFRRAGEYIFKLTGYFLDGIKIDKRVGAGSKLAYGRFD